jgi:DNA-binding CsgD family transcriptional regulator
LTFNKLLSQERPPIQIYASTDYGAETQNWSISQSKEHYIYVANNKGLLEFNGASWQLYASPNETIIRSVNVIDDLIYTGCNNEFGYWKRNELGLLFYTSLSERLKIDFLEDEDFWNIIAIDDFILFQSLKRIYIYNKENETYNTIDSDNIIYKIFKVNGKIYYQNTSEGLYLIENGKSKLVSDDVIIKENRLVNIFNHNGVFLIETENKGFYILDNLLLTKWDIPANKELSEVSVFRSIMLKDGSFILGTRSNGVLHMTPSGTISYNIDVVHGLGNNTVHWIFEDAESNIWLALENGINCINIKSPFSIYKDEEGKIGTVYASAIFNDILYLGTNQGLFYKPMQSKEHFKPVESILEAVWCLVVTDNQLFCGHDTGTSIINDTISTKIEGIQQGTWSIKPIEKTGLLLQGNYNGLYVLEKVNNTWRFRNKIKGFDLSSKFFEIHDGKIFVSHEYKGVFKLKVDDDFFNVIEVIKDSTINKEVNSSIIKYKDDLLYAYKDGVLKFNKQHNKFIKDSVLSTLYDASEYSSGKLVFNNNSNTLWNFSNKELSYMSPNNLSNTLKVNKVPFSKSLPRALTGYENITHLTDKKYLIGASNGFIIIDLDKVTNKSHTISINTISNHKRNAEAQLLNLNSDGYFKNNDNNIEFTFSVAEYDKYLDTEFQYQLEGMFPKWSNWSTDSNILFENLPFGDYVFNVRARVGNVLSKNIASYSFNIERPWLLSNLMIFTYFLIVALFSLFMHHVYKRYYRKQREKLVEKSKRELELKELENKQQLMRFNNDNLRQDIENKNRELGISTMSLIKKNEFLNSIKSELKNVSNSEKGLKQVIKMIDRNLNNNDDWHVFEEAFNNADKDFLKKIKTEHPSLTSNDLRLCAYLRLNLSSKEIAPLLNISPRSVEVKRYRLRKKMNLEHESSLTDYILEI